MNSPQIVSPSEMSNALISFGDNPESSNLYDKNIEQALDQFEIALKHSDADAWTRDLTFNAAVNIFCLANNLDNRPVDCNKVLDGICHLITKPVNAAFIIRLIEYLQEYMGTHLSYLDSVVTSYINLWNVSHLIDDWDSIKNLNVPLFKAIQF